MVKWPDILRSLARSQMLANYSSQARLCWPEYGSDDCLLNWIVSSWICSMTVFLLMFSLSFSNSSMLLSLLLLSCYQNSKFGVGFKSCIVYGYFPICNVALIELSGLLEKLARDTCIYILLWRPFDAARSIFDAFSRAKINRFMPGQCICTCL